jgi:L-amino acid N-acyltransferase YncA
MGSDCLIRMATEADAGEIVKIYAPYVTDTAVTFEYDVPSAEEFAQRMREILQTYPYLVASEEGRIVGYAYATALRKRVAYSRAVETTVYVEKDNRGRGLGSKLYRALEAILKRQNIINLYACIAYAPAEDAHLNNASAAFHERAGYAMCGRFTRCGYKFGKWYDVVWMEKMLGEHPEKPEPVIPVVELKA